MPLLKKKIFEKAPTVLLHDDEEVFYCEITGEVFRDYEEFSERMFLCNSMVWTCSMTGKNNLTYQEALESEENARRALKEFPVELKAPILFLANKIKKKGFADLADNVYLFVKDRYFIGESVEASFSGNMWKESHVLQVIPPAENSKSPKNGNKEKLLSPSPELYKYELEHLDTEDRDISEIMIVSHSQIRRKKFLKERCKMFLKQYIEQNEDGFWVVKQSALKEFKIDQLKWEHIFSGPLPKFDSPKKEKKTKQETLAKFLQKQNGDVSKEGQNNLLEKLKKRTEQFQIDKQRKQEERVAMKQKLKEESIKLAVHLKEWHKPKEDLELEDQKKLPDVVPVKSKVPDRYLGDMLMIMEFVEQFAKFLSLKDYFAQGISFEIMERALTEKEVAGPYTDLIHMFLSTLFNLQDEESAQYRTTLLDDSSVIKEALPKNLSLTEGTKLATQASRWSKNYQGLNLGELPLYSLTVSEVLRLHLLSSGARINETGAKWRYQQRGGYTSEDDPGLYLRLHQPHILKALAIHNVVQLPLSDKLKILSCLMNQLLTYADVRDIIEDKLDHLRQVKADIRSEQIMERQLEKEFITNRAKIKKSIKENPTPELNSELDKLTALYEKKKLECERKSLKMLKDSVKNQTYMGMDRAFRKYYKFESIPGVFINFEEDYPGTCLHEVVKQYPELATAGREEIMEHVRRINEEMNTSDKENDPKKSPKKVNGVRNSCSNENDLLMCTADRNTCLVHSNKIEKPRWSFLHQRSQVDDLVAGLNKRGMREKDLLEIISVDKDKLSSIVDQTPINSLNAEVDIKQEKELRPLRKKGKDRYEDANFGFPPEMGTEEVLHNTLLDNILEMEEKIHVGGLGGLLVKDREAWRDCLVNKRYEEFDTVIEKRKDIKSEENMEEEEVEVKEYIDPGKYLGPTLEVESEDSDQEEVMLLQPKYLTVAIRALSVALAQVARAVEPQHLKRPLGNVFLGKKQMKKDCNVLDKWQESLLASTSFSQVFLHYGTLDSCIMWSRSALLARCRICKRQKDSENMLLCDSCNLGHHLYCLKPKLTAVPQGDWFCKKCQAERQEDQKPVKMEMRKRRRIFTEEDDDGEDEDSIKKEVNGNDYEDEDVSNKDDDDSASIKSDICSMCSSGGELVTCEKCSISYHIECCKPPLRRMPRGSWMCQKCRDGEEEVGLRRSNRRDDFREDLPLHNAALQELLSDVMKHPDAWPFLRPVQKNEVPDYYDVITKPMDFGTIKYKLNMGEYKDDYQLMKDVNLVFDNCNTYNHTEADVYKCGEKVLKHFQKKSKELGLKLPAELRSEEDEEIPPRNKKRRTR